MPVKRRKYEFDIDFNGCGIYEFVNKKDESRESYVGSSINLYARLWRHLRDLRKNRHDNENLQEAWNTDGPDSLYVRIKNYCPGEITDYIEKNIWLEEKEQWYFDNTPCVYNINRSATRRNMAAAIVNGTMVPSKPVKRIDRITGEIKVYDSILDTAADGFNPSGVGACANGKQGTTSGYLWEFLYHTPISGLWTKATKFIFRPVIGTTAAGDSILINSREELQNTEYKYSRIVKSCTGKQALHLGMTWRYQDEVYQTEVGTEQKQMRDCFILYENAVIGKSRIYGVEKSYSNFYEAEKDGWVKTKILGCAIGLPGHISVKGYDWFFENAELREVYALAKEAANTKFVRPSRPVVAICKETFSIKFYETMNDARKDGFKTEYINQCCEGKILSHFGYKFIYQDSFDSERNPASYF